MIQSLPELLAFAARQWPDRTYLQTRAGEQIHAQSFAEVHRTAQAIATSLLAWGLHPGDRIALLSENCLEWVTAYFGILCAGAIVVPLDSLMQPAEIVDILRAARAKLLLTTHKFEAALRTAAPDAMAERPVFLLEADAGAASLAHLTRHPVDRPLPAAAPASVAVIIFTSGTTGYSKGVVLTHANLASDVAAFVQTGLISPDDNFHLILPLHHTYSSTVNMLGALAVGARATFGTSYKSRDIVDDIRIGGVTLLVGVPQIFENMMNGMLRAVSEAPWPKRVLFRTFYRVSQLASAFGIPLGRLLFRSLRRKAGLDGMRLMISGGAALPPFVNRFFQRLGFSLLQGYGLTETSPVISVNLPGRNRIGSVGPALPGVEFRIENPDAAGVGEICVRGPMVMQGYFENPDATAAVLRGGWFHTGDAGCLDRDGFLFITGRIKNIIVTAAGKNIYPEEIEARLNAAPFILESLVLPDIRRKGGEELAALIVPDTAALAAAKERGEAVDLESAIKSAVDEYNRAAPAYRRLRKWRLHDGELEKTSTRKIRRYLYKSAFAQRR